MTVIRTRDVRVGEHSFRLSESGDPRREAVLWLHGSGPGATALSNWQGVLPELAPDFYNLAPDVLGFGDSSHPDPAPQGMRAFTQLRVETLLALLDTLQLERVHLVGNSMGGMISLTLVHQAPERVGRLVLMGTGGAPLPPTPDLIKLITFYNDPTTEAMAELLSCFVHDPGFFGSELKKVAEARMPRALRDDVRRSHLATFAPGPPPSFSPEMLAAILNPTLVVHGREDRIVPVAGAHYFEANIPNARLHVMPKTGHWLQIEQQRPFVHLVRAFLGGEV